MALQAVCCPRLHTTIIATAISNICLYLKESPLIIYSALYSTLGQGLQTSTYPGESIFSIALAIFGLILFALLIGNMQVTLELSCSSMMAM